jgi:sulfur carrier protein ThiS
MRITLKSNFDLGLEEIELPGDGATLRNLLEELGRHHRDMDFIDPRSPTDVEEYFSVSINGKEYRFLPQRLDSPLKDGDEVEVAVVMFGGG